MSLSTDTVRRGTVPRALQLRLALGRAAEALAFISAGKSKAPDVGEVLMEAADLLDVALPRAQGPSTSVAERRAQTEILFAVQEDPSAKPDELINRLQGLAGQLREAAHSSQVGEDLESLMSDVLAVRHAVAASRSRPPDLVRR